MREGTAGKEAKWRKSEQVALGGDSTTIALLVTEKPFVGLGHWRIPPSPPSAQRQLLKASAKEE